MKRSICLLVILLFVLQACKVSQVSTSSDQIESEQEVNTDQQTEKIEIPQDQVPFIIQPTDSIEIRIHRVLRDTVSIIGVGDIMMGTNYPDESYLPPHDGKYLLQEVSPILKSADLTFGNLEGVLLDGEGNPKTCKDPKICYIFKSPAHYAQHLADAGFDVVSTANNHAGDFGDPGRKSTMQALDSAGIYHAGLLPVKYVTFRKGGVNYGFAAFAPNAGTLSIHDLKQAKSIVSHLDSISDIVIVSFHGGAEGAQYQHVTRKEELFYGENRGNVYSFAHAMVDAGADIIFGHGPHVTRAVEVYQNRFIAYSLGNFCTYARFNLSNENGLAPIIKVYTNGTGEFIKAQVTPVIQYRPGGPVIDRQNRVIKILQDLTKKDFPEINISIDDTGLITYLDHQ
jgi:hypothetical protein